MSRLIHNKFQSNERTTANDHFQDVRLIKLSCPNIKWEPGDVFVVRPHNSSERVDELFALLAEYNFDFNENTIIRLYEFDSGK